MRWSGLGEGVVLALDQLRANKFRSFLTILGVVVGVATVMAMSAMVAGIRNSIMSELEAAGPKNFIVARFDWNDVRVVSDQHGPPWGNNPEVAVEEARRIAQLPAVRNAIVDFDLAGDMDAGKEKLTSVNISADDAGWEAFTTGTFVAGHNFLPTDVQGARPLVVLSRPLAEQLFGTLDPIGRRVRIRGSAFEVVGVFEMSDNIFASLVKHFAVIPYTAALKHLSGVNTEFLSVLVVTAPHATQDQAMDQVIAALRTMRRLRPGESNDFAVIRQQEMARTFNRITNVFFMVMLALSSVGLMVGGVGVIAIMMIAVTERTREIGIRKALGATSREILWQFLVEATTLTVAGGAIGMLIGGGGAFLVSALTPIPARVPFYAVIAALGTAGVTGILFGLWPAWRAARLDPVAALRYE